MYPINSLQVRENIEKSGIDYKGVPMAEILLGFGFFCIYLIEETVHYFFDTDVHHHNDESIQVHQSFSIHSQACEAGLVDVQLDSTSPKVEQRKRIRTVSYPSSFENNDVIPHNNDAVVSFAHKKLTLQSSDEDTRPRNR